MQDKSYFTTETQSHREILWEFNLLPLSVSLCLCGELLVGKAR